MHKSDGANHWFSGWRIVARPAALDPADVGTAFGMELSLSAEAPAIAPPAPAAKSPNGWVRRMRHPRRGAA